jgi:hypothetical protein
MKTFNIIASTNGYIASRDINFNGRTSYVAESNLSHSQAKETLRKFFEKDYDNAILCENENEWLLNRYFTLIEEQANACALSIDDYFAATSKRWKLYADKSVKNYMKYEGPGYYCMENYAGRLFHENSESYEYDSRYYRIEEMEEAE